MVPAHALRLGLPPGADGLAELRVPLLALMCVPGAFWLARARRWATLALLSGWPLLLLLFLGIPYENSRLSTRAAALAALAGLGSHGLASAGRWRRGALLIALAAAWRAGWPGACATPQAGDYKNDQLALGWVARAPAVRQARLIPSARR